MPDKCSFLYIGSPYILTLGLRGARGKWVEPSGESTADSGESMCKGPGEAEATQGIGVLAGTGGRYPGSGEVRAWHGAGARSHSASQAMERGGDFIPILVGSHWKRSAEG